MKTALHLDDKTITKSIANGFGINVADLEFIPEGEDSWLYSCRNANNGQKLVVKIQKKSKKVAAEAYKALFKAGYNWMPQPIMSKSDQIWRRKGRYNYSLQQFIESNLDNHIFEFDDDYLPQLGRAMKKLHSINLSEPVAKRIQHEKYLPIYHDNLETFIKKLSKTSLKKYQDLRKIYEQNETTILKLQQQVLATGKKLKAMSLPLVLVHGDIHPYNLLQSNNGLCLIDWDSCRMAQKENDLMYFNDRQIKLLSKGYGEDLLKNRTAIEYYRMWLKVREISYFGYLLGMKGRSPQERARGLKSFREVCEKLQTEMA